MVQKYFVRLHKLKETFLSNVYSVLDENAVLFFIIRQGNKMKSIEGCIFLLSLVFRFQNSHNWLLRYNSK